MNPDFLEVLMALKERPRFPADQTRTAPVPQVRGDSALSPIQERAFREWYAGWAGRAGLDPNPDNPLHKYDYRAAFRAGAKPEIDDGDGLYHWPSQFKADDHPNRFVKGVGDTKTLDSSGLPEILRPRQRPVPTLTPAEEMYLEMLRTMPRSQRERAVQQHITMRSTTGERAVLPQLRMLDRMLASTPTPEMR